MKSETWVQWAVLVLVPIILATTGFALSIERRVDKLEEDRAAILSTLTNIDRVLTRIDSKLDTYDKNINTFYKRGPVFSADLKGALDHHETRGH